MVVLMCWLVLVAGAQAGLGHREKRFLDGRWWEQFHSGVERLGHESRKDMDSLSGWAQQVEEEMRPAIDRFGKEVGGLVTGLMDTIEDSPLFEHAIMNREDGSAIITGDHSIGLAAAEDNLSLPSSGPGILSHMERFGDHFERFGGHMGSELGGLDMQSFDPFSIFGMVRKKWYQGDNVCTEREVVEEEDAPERINVNNNGFGVFQMNMQVSQCRDDDNTHECTTTITEGGVKKTIILRYFCCHGHKREVGQIGCAEVDMKPLEDTVRDLGGLEFLVLLDETNMLDKLKENMTLFVPTNDAIEDFHRDLVELNTIDSGEDVAYGIDEGLTSRRRKRDLTITEAPRLQDIILAHMTKGFVSATDMEDEGLMETEASENGKIRINVYNTYPKKVIMANCAKITSRNNFATNGIVHMVDKVIVPAKHTVGQIISQDLGFEKFSEALEKSGLMKQLSEEGQFTVFAPSDKAMDKLDNDIRERLMSGSGCAADILKNHILPNVICSGIIEGKAKTNNLQDKYITMERDEEGDVLVEGMKLKMKDIVGTNGVIHVIEDVLVPESARTVVDALKTRKMKTILELFDSAKLTEAVSDMSNMTLFVPTEKALAELPDTFIEELKSDSQKLKEFLMYHMATPRKCKCDFENNLMLQSGMENQKIRVNTYGASLMFGDRFKVATAQCAKIVNLDDEVCGGMIHTVDKVLLPPAGDIMDVVTNSGKYSKFMELVDFSGLKEELESETGKTLLVPTDSAFEKIDEEIAKKLAEDKEFAQKVVRKHLLKEVLCCSGIQRNNLLFNNSRKRSSSGDLVAVRRSNSGHLYADKAEISKCDMIASNGVVHQIESLLATSAVTNTAQERIDTFTDIFNFNPFKLFE
eukprot:GFUD01010161.1.p1 GENE.GFUD01010161.1~~GFUD01010161.1.p1  ORF type:complete len:868 (+),score=289.70 GFUD01010161.1:35-2638(+)